MYMTIDEFWNDVDIFYVVFEPMEIINDNNRFIKKLIVLPSETNLESVKSIVKNNFNNVKKVEHIELWDNALLLKRKLNM